MGQDVEDLGKVVDGLRLMKYTAQKPLELSEALTSLIRKNWGDGIYV